MRKWKKAAKSAGKQIGGMVVKAVAAGAWALIVIAVLDKLTGVKSFG